MEFRTLSKQCVFLVGVMALLAGCARAIGDGDSAGFSAVKIINSPIGYDCFVIMNGPVVVGGNCVLDSTWSKGSCC